ncbi:MAG TPA: hypothetical protein VJS69_09390 [Candidatus Krumholzibacteria bacterium]|nr:hypothetical protein [Candidatus Krumholzibacteria bacterium]
MKTERVVMCRLDRGLYENGHIVNCVYTAGLCRRTVEVSWDSEKKQLVFSVLRPMTKRIAAVVEGKVAGRIA